MTDDFRMRHYLVVAALIVAGAGGPFVYYGNPWACIACMSVALLLVSVAAIMPPGLRPFCQRVTNCTDRSVISAVPGGR